MQDRSDDLGAGDGPVKTAVFADGPAVLYLIAPEQSSRAQRLPFFLQERDGQEVSAQQAQVTETV